MKYIGLELFMEKLKQMIYNDDNPLITNHPSILSQRPRFQLLYEELGSMIQTFHLIEEQHHELQQVRDLKKRFKDAAEDAHDLIDLFVYNVNLNSQPEATKGGHHTWLSVYCGCGRSTNIVGKEEISMNLGDIMTSIISIKKEFIMIHENMKIDSFPTTDHIKAGPSYNKNPLETKKALENIVVGFDDHAALIRDKLVEDQRQLDVVSIVGMGGVGKTTLATKVFNDRFIMHHFHVRGWVTVSQTYEKQDMLIQLLVSIGNKIESISNLDYSKLREKLHKRLISNRYLIVIDDIWSTEAWDVLKLFFPINHTQSRILLTSRLNEVALHAKSHGFIHRLEYLNKEESWELLCKKVFHDNNAFPEWLVKPGMEIAKNCHGLPLTLAVIAGVLAKEPLTKDSWERFGRSVSSYIVNGQADYIDQLALSIDHLPGPLRDCFLYLGGFPEDHKFQLANLIWLWMAEGFIKEDGHRSLEEIGEDWFMELVDRNLVVVKDRKFNGGIKAFYVHDLLRELCLKIATKECLIHKAEYMMHSTEAYKQHRIFIDSDIKIMNAPKIRSLLCFFRLDHTRVIISKWFHMWMLLMVLDLRGWQLIYFPEEMSHLVHLRYLAISYHGYRKFPTSICKLCNLQTLIIRYEGFRFFEMPKTISNLVNLRHLICQGSYVRILFPAFEKPMNLQTITGVMFGGKVESWVKCFPGVKKLSCYVQRRKEIKKCDLESLTFLEHMKLSRLWGKSWQMKFTGFPPSLKSLTLERCYLPWSYILIIQALPNLEVLKLLSDSFMGSRWDVGENQFHQLKFLKLYKLRIKKWEAFSNNFPRLKQLAVEWCTELKEIPFDFGNIPTLELIRVSGCGRCVTESLDAIEEEQHAQGNFELKIERYINREKIRWN